MSSSDHFPNPTTIETKIPSNYVLPQHGIFSILPTPWIPYAELMRLDRPAGYYAFYWHYAIGTAFAACISTPPLSSVILTALYYSCAVIILRGISCTWNDNLDQEFDRKVARCRNRPIARGAVTTLQGHVFTAVQMVIGAIMVLPLPKECILHIAFIVAVLGIYPLGKRLTDFPQLILGLGLSYPTFLCCATFSVDINPLGGESDFQPALCLFVAGALWTIVFDTIYAHQDILDDKKAGVRSLAVLLGDRTKLCVSFLVVAQVAMLFVTGLLAGFSILYFIGCFGAAVALGSMIWRVNLKSPASCGWWFGPGSKLVGGNIVLGLAAEYLWRSSSRF